MKSSIRKFLLLNLLVAISITTSITAIGNYYLDQKDIQEHLDTLMALSALSYEALLGDDIHERKLDKIQKNLHQIPQQLVNTFQKSEEIIPTENYLNKFYFQVWTQAGQLLLSSKSAPEFLKNPHPAGFSDISFNKEDWRVFTTYNIQSNTRIVLAERYDTRNELGQRIAQDDLYIMLLTFPLSGLLIWIIIGRGLSSLDRVAKEVADRETNRLEPVNIKEVPTEIKPVIDELNQLFHRLQEGFEREKRFAADAAHELRTPLAALKTHAQVALNTNNLEEKNRALQKLITSVNRGTHVVQQLLTMSKLVPEAIRFTELEEVNLSKLSKEVISMLVPSALEKQIELELIDNLKHHFMGNPTAVSILIRNLVDNAIRYCKESGKIVVKVYNLNKEAVLEVIDNGPGIPKELQSRVFERFFRVLGNVSPGSGLGLAIVQQICALHNAKIVLDSPKKGTGLIVKVFFPLVDKRA